MDATHVVKTKTGTEVTNPPIARLLFDDTRFSVVWLVVRVLLGLSWVNASLHKLSDPGWMQTGASLKGFWENALGVKTGKPLIAADFGWYKDFITNMYNAGSYVWFAKLVAIGEFSVGICLIIGAFVGVAAFIGAFMNWNFIMAGSASTNPLLFVAAVLLLLAWKTAGYWGADRFLLPLLGTPWGRKAAKAPAVSEAAAD